MLMVYMLYVKLALIELALLNLMISLEPLRVLRTLRYTPRRGWNGSYASNISIVINNNDYIDLMNTSLFHPPRGVERSEAERSTNP